MRREGRGLRFAPCPGCGGGSTDSGWIRPGRTGLVGGCNGGCGFEALRNALWPHGSRRTADPNPFARANTRPATPRRSTSPYGRRSAGATPNGPNSADPPETEAHRATETAERDPPQGRDTPDIDPADPAGGDSPEELAEVRRGLEQVFDEWRGRGRDPLTTWRAIRDTVAEVGLPVECLPPRPVLAETRPDPLLPVVQSIREAPERTAGRLAFGGLVAGREPMDGQLPLLPAPDGPRVPLLELADVRGGPIMAKGRGAPLDLRLFVGAVLWTPHSSRAARGRIAVTVRELRDFLLPNGWERRRDWPRIREALLRAGDYMLPGVYQHERGNVHGWIPFRLAGGIGEGAGLDDVVLIDVELPPGSAHGPVIDRGELSRLGVDSAPRFRAYLAVHSVAWLPGRTRIPHPRNRRVKLWTGDPGKYHVKTAEDRRRLGFGAADASHRTRAEQDAPWKALPGCTILTRSASTPDGRRGWVIVPDAAAEAVQKRALTGEPEGANRGTESALEPMNSRFWRGPTPTTTTTVVGRGRGGAVAEALGRSACAPRCR
ncbi:MAG: hypothetical protein J4F34_07545 [Gemmatimonadetes bacterium]|nr:hypothetical protein [Gemmatimonadota bacterium]